jgi:hypothetical protein
VTNGEQVIENILAFQNRTCAGVNDLFLFLFTKYQRLCGRTRTKDLIVSVTTPSLKDKYERYYHHNKNLTGFLLEVEYSIQRSFIGHAG